MKSDKTIYRMFLLQHEQALLKMRKQTSLSPWGVNSLFFQMSDNIEKKRNLNVYDTSNIVETHYDVHLPSLRCLKDLYLNVTRRETHSVNPE